MAALRRASYRRSVLHLGGQAVGLSLPPMPMPVWAPDSYDLAARVPLLGARLVAEGWLSWKAGPDPG